MILLGDRYEAFAAAQTAMFLQIPVAHIHGGEITEGLIDEAIGILLPKYHIFILSLHKNIMIGLFSLVKLLKMFIWLGP